MSQKTRPVAPDVSNVTWVPDPVYPEVNEPTPNDATFVTSSGASTGDVFEVRLGDLSWPLPGGQTLRVRLAGGSGSGGAGNWARAELRQAGTTLASRGVAVPGAFQTIEWPLSDAERRAIRYDEDLRARNLTVRVSVQPPVQTTCCAAAVPVGVTGTVTNKTGFAVGLPDTMTFVRDPAPSSFWRWNGELVCGGTARPVDLEFACAGSAPNNFQLYSGASIIGPTGQAPDASPTPTCSPLSIQWTVSGTFGCGTGGYTLVVTE